MATGNNKPPSSISQQRPGAIPPNGSNQRPAPLALHMKLNRPGGVAAFDCWAKVAARLTEPLTMTASLTALGQT